MNSLTHRHANTNIQAPHFQHFERILLTKLHQSPISSRHFLQSPTQRRVNSNTNINNFCTVDISNIKLIPFRNKQQFTKMFYNCNTEKLYSTMRYIKAIAMRNDDSPNCKLIRSCSNSRSLGNTRIENNTKPTLKLRLINVNSDLQCGDKSGMLTVKHSTEDNRKKVELFIPKVY